MIKNKKSLEQLLEAALMGENKNNRFRITVAIVDLNDNDIKAFGLMSISWTQKIELY